ncbi:hypothetical protein [Halovenus amylolytica]|uniref:hypothetical protein n=1 Tax=Halovenus amylolytica TaxID=2500550 RepID=UPI003D6AA5E2
MEYPESAAKTLAIRNCFQYILVIITYTWSKMNKLGKALFHNESVKDLPEPNISVKTGENRVINFSLFLFRVLFSLN